MIAVGDIQMPFFGIKLPKERRSIREQRQRAVSLLRNAHDEIHGAIEGSAHPFDSMIRFFNATSELHDNIDELHKAVAASGLKKAEFKSAQEVLSQLQEQIRNGGRSPYGINRTNPGEKVDESNVFLGNVWGLWTFPINKWRSTEYNDVNYNGEYGGNKLGFNPITRQAQRFVQSYKTMPGNIKKLLGYLEERK